MSEELCPVTDLPFSQCAEDDKSPKHIAAHIRNLIRTGQVLAPPSLTEDEAVEEFVRLHMTEQN